jgi:TonB family protein
MKYINIIVAMLLVCATAAAQIAQIQSFEKQAVDAVQHMLVSKLDAELPRSSFGIWFSRIIGPEAGVVWQLTECGERGVQRGGAERELIACAEANAVLPDGRQVIVAVSVGTFKNGISGEPAFYSAVIGQNDQLYPIRRLRDLPNLLRGQGNLPVRLPDITADLPQATHSGPAYIPLSKMNPYPWTEILAAPEAQIAETDSSSVAEEIREVPKPQKPQKVQEGILQGRAITRVMPVYPANARSLNAFGTVVVQVVVSEDGRVIDAKAISGHPVLRTPAVEAARKWVFQPTMLNKAPVKVESVLTFVFKTGSQ